MKTDIGLSLIIARSDVFKLLSCCTLFLQTAFSLVPYNIGCLVICPSWGKVRQKVKLGSKAICNNTCEFPEGQCFAFFLCKNAPDSSEYTRRLMQK